MIRARHIAPGQAGFDFTPRARAADLQTSHAAARQVSAFAGGHYHLIVEALRNHGSATIHEIATRTWLDVHAVARRMPELKTAGLVEATAETRPSPTGRQCTVWAATIPGGQQS